MKISKTFITTIISIILVFGLLIGSLSGNNFARRILQIPAAIIMTPGYIAKNVICKNIGGEITYGCGDRVEKCYYISDNGKSCKSSKDCKGLCVVSNPKLGEVQGKYEPAGLEKCRKINVNNQKGLVLAEYDCSNQNFEAKCEFTRPQSHGKKWVFNNGIISYQENPNDLVKCFGM